MTERGILFKPWLIDTIKHGHKTETRRLSMRLATLKRGDLLWVKEKLMRQDADGFSSWAEYARDGRYVEPSPFRWRWERDWLSPLHMPREAARLLLRLVEDARVERFDDIGGGGAVREGVQRFGFGGGMWGFDGPSMTWLWRRSAREAFLDAWVELHPTVPLDAEVVVLRFERVEV